MKRILTSVLLAMCLTVPAFANEARDKFIEKRVDRLIAKERNTHTADLGVVFQTPNGRMWHLKEKMTPNDCHEELRKYGVSWKTGKPYVYTIEPTSSMDSHYRKYVPKTTTGEVVDMICVINGDQQTLEHSSWRYAAVDTLESLEINGVWPRRYPSALIARD